VPQGKPDRRPMSDITVKTVEKSSEVGKAAGSLDGFSDIGTG